MQFLTRRSFVVGAGLATGFALAASPIYAQAILTDSDGLTAGVVQVPTSDGNIPAYRAMPSTGNNFPIVLVVQEIFGVHAHIQDICRRLAKLGYLAIAPEMFYRQGDVSRLTSIDQIRPIVARVPDTQVMADLDSAITWASSQGNPNKVGITGFCWGGRIVWLYASHNPRIRAGVAWYGRLVGESTPLTPLHPVDIAATLTVPILGLYAGADSSIPNDTVEQMRQALQNSRSGSQIILYPGMPHAFFADYRASYRKEQAEDGWWRLQDWFKRHSVQ